jgi:hypothetical protein
MLLAITFLILVSSLSFDDILGQTYAIYIIASWSRIRYRFSYFSSFL